VKYLLIRHGKTDADRLTRAAFGKSGAPLSDAGKAQATKLKEELLSRSIDLDQELVVVSQLLRTIETARLAGFTNIEVNPLLNEVNTDNPQNTLNLVAQGLVPQEAIDAAKAIISNPPAAKIWVTHGLVIAAIQYVLGQVDPDHFVPNFCEVREIEL